MGRRDTRRGLPASRSGYDAERSCVSCDVRQAVRTVECRSPQESGTVVRERDAARGHGQPGSTLVSV